MHSFVTHAEDVAIARARAVCGAARADAAADALE
jgi:hypothetical protein